MNKLMQLPNRSTTITKISFFVIISAILLTGLITINAHKAFAATSIFGDVICANGTVNGVWVQDNSSPSYSGWGYELSNYADFNWKKTVNSLNDSYQLHVGCNGVWKNSPYTFHGYYSRLFVEQWGNSLIFSLTGFQ